MPARSARAKGGRVVDATVIAARRPRLGRAGKRTIKGGIPAERKPARPAPIGRDGRRTLKRARQREAAPGEGPKRRVAIAAPAFGDKNHVGIDREHGFLRCCTLAHAAARDGGRLGAVPDRDNPGSEVRADTAHRSAANLALIERRGRKPQFQRKNPSGRRMPAPIARGNADCARVRSRLERLFADRKCRLGLLVRTVGKVRARAPIGLANLACNFTRPARLSGRIAAAAPA